MTEQSQMPLIGPPKRRGWREIGWFRPLTPSTHAALVQRLRSLGLVLRRADVTVTLDEPTRAHAEALRFAMRERPLHFQIAIESLEPDRSFDVTVGGSYRVTERRTQDGPSDTTEG